MPGWWSKLTGWMGGGPAEASSPAPDEGAAQEPATWLPADDPGNPFGVEILDLMITQQLIATSRDPAQASTSVSWRSSTGAELDPSPLAERPRHPCALRFPVAGPLPAGLLFAPDSMDQKWVIAWRDDRIIVARSWTGEVEAVADAHLEEGALVVDALRVTEGSPLDQDNRTDVLDWLIRSHALGEKLPFPLDDGSAALFERLPTLAFTGFGNVIFCGARGWEPPPPSRPLHSDGRVVQAVRAGALGELRAAVEAGEAVDAPSTFSGYTALHLAIVQGNLQVLECLLALGADPEAAGDRGSRAAHLAIVHDAPFEVLEALAARGVSWTPKNADGFEPLHAVAETDRARFVPWLLEHGAQLEATTGPGHTAFHIACALGHRAAAEALLAAGADRGAIANGQSALDIARAEGREEIVTWLASLG